MPKDIFLNIAQIKKNIISLSLPKRKFLLLTFLMPKKLRLLWAILLLLILSPLRSASAVCFDATCIATEIFLFFFKIINGVSNLILQAALFILNWILSEGFMPWAYTVPGNAAGQNPIIGVGWTLTRDLANMSFVIILVIIGLGTALKIGEYQAQKTIPTLILIALLINFTPVLLGLMLDAANITMNFFLEKVSGLDAWGRVTEAQSALMLQTLQRAGISGSYLILFQIVLLFIINLLSAAIILAFAGLFLVRYVAIWLLVIVSPVVFASYILPQTRRLYWSRWWNEFVQWTIIGIPSAFFLYLGNFIMVKAPTMGLAPPPSSNIWDATFYNLMTSVLPYIIALIFLWIGFFVTLTSSASGAGNIIKTVRSGVTKGRGFAQRRGASLARKHLLEDRERIRTSIQDRAEKMALMTGVGRPTWGKGQRGVGGWVKRRAAGVAGLGTIPFNLPGVKQVVTPAIAEAGRAMGRAGMEISASGKRRVGEAKGEADKLIDAGGVTKFMSGFRDQTDIASKVGYLKSLLEKNKLNDVLEKKLIPEKDLIELIHKSRQYGEESELLAAMPHLVKDAVQLTANRYVDPETGRPISLAQAYAKSIKDEPLSGIIEKIKPEQAGRMSKEVFSKNPAGVFEHPEILEAMIRSWGGSQIGAFLKTHEQAGADAITKTIEDLGGTAFLEKENAKLLRYLRKNNYAREFFDYERSSGPAPAAGPTPAAGGPGPAPGGGGGPAPGPRRRRYTPPPPPPSSPPPHTPPPPGP